MSKAVLITGVAGFIGSRLADYLIDKGYTVYGVDNLSQGLKEHIPSKVIFSELDITTVKSEDLSHLEKINFDVFPNPFKTHINIVTNDNETHYSKYEVYSLSGKFISEGKILITNKNTIKINLASLKSGPYVLNIYSKKTRKKIKVIKL